MALLQNTAKVNDEWLQTSLGRYIFSRQKELILDLITPRAGERVLDIGCATSIYLQIFREKWCLATGIDCSELIPETSRRKTEKKVELDGDVAGDLPFADDEFDIVTIINALETAADPQKTIAEAIRVCRGRVFIGFLNKHSFMGTRQRRKEIFGFPLTGNIRFFSIEEIRKMVANLIGAQACRWGSVIYFPTIVYDIFTELEEIVPHTKNPLGAFAGLVFPVKYTYRTVQSPVLESYPLKSDSRVTAPEAIRGMLKERGR
jgi:ubiquinone/menaquinone biosynthesis C-methylase UbiE